MKLQTRIKLVLLLVCLLISLFVMGSKSSTVMTKARINTLKTADKLVRLHVVANSNSLEDQRIKRKIRDVVLAQTAKVFADQVSSKQPKTVLKNNKAQLQRVVESYLQSLGVNYGVRLKLGQFKFPTRSYGGVTLKAGNYDALQVILGAGQGENWWCVLFPPLCFIDSRNEVSEEKLKKLATKPEDRQLAVEFKLKSIELIKNNPQVVKSKLNWIKILKTSLPGIEQLIYSGEQQKADK